MTVPFNHIPNNLRVPLFYAEVDNSMANSGASSMRRLIVAQVNDDATAEEIGSLAIVSSPAQARQIGGPGSMLAAMYATWRLSDPFGEIWCIGLKHTEGVKAAGTLTLTGTAGAGGLLSLYIAGHRVQAVVLAGGSAADAAAALAAKVNALADLPVTAQAVGGAVTFTCKWTGASGNDISLILNRLGKSNGEELPQGLTAVVAAMAGGAGAPDMADALAALGDEPFEFICQPWTDTTSLDAWKLAMDDSAGRWSWTKQLWGHVYSARRGTLGEQVAAGQARNDQHMTIHGVEPQIPQPVWVFAAAMAARTAVFISADVSRPTQTGALSGIDPSPSSVRFILTERQSLLEYGTATSTYSGGAQRIERSVTTYRVNAYDQPDDSYLDSETMHQTAYVIRRLQSIVTSKYGRHKLANDGTRFGAGAALVTPAVVRGELLSEYAKLEEEGHVENAELFARHLIVERDPNSPNRLNVLFPPDYVNQLRVFALLNQFRLQYA